MSLLDDIWTRIVQPEPDLAPWEWLERSVESIPYSPMPGGLDTSSDPIIREVLNLICDPANSLVVICCAVQRFKTLALELAITWTVKNSPAPTIFFQDTDDNAKDEMQFRLRLLLENTKGAAELIPTGRHKDKAKNASILFNNGMTLWVLGAINPRNLQRRSIRRILMDECWQYPNSRNSIRQAEKRTTRFSFGQLILASQGAETDGEKGAEFVEYLEKTDKRVEHVACPDCKEYQPMELKFLNFEPIKDPDGNYDFKAMAPTVHFECQHCGSKWENSEETRWKLRQSSKLVASNPNAASGKVGIIATAFPFLDWAMLAEEYLRAKMASYKGDIGPLKLFYQQRCAQNWTANDGDDFTFEVSGSGYMIADAGDWPDEARIRVLNRKVGILPPRITNRQGTWAARSLVVDVQQDCFWTVARSWSYTGQSRMLRAGKLQSWGEIALLAENLGIHPSMVFIDSGDKPGAEVYPMAAKHGWTCLRGDGAESFKHIIRPKSPDERPKTVTRAYSMVKYHRIGQQEVRIIHWSNLSIKDQLAKLINMPDRWGVPDDIDEHCKDYRSQMDSERRGKSKMGKPIWLQVGKRPNHLWDCEAMAVVVGNILKILGAEVAETEPAES